MPVRLEQTKAERQVFQRQIFELRQRFALHPLLDALAVLIELIELYGHVARQCFVFAEQALDAQRHVVQASCRVQSWAEDKTEIGGGDAAVIAPSHFENCSQTRASPTRTNPRKPLM